MIGDVLTHLGPKTAADLAKGGVTTGFVELDVSSERQWEAAVDATVGVLGGYDILVNNAGVEKAAPLIDIEAEDLRRMFDVNVLGTALGMKHAFRAMRPGGSAGAGGAVVNICSAAALNSNPTLASYSASKSAVERLTRIGAVEAGKLGYGV
jgi:3alpha(or 20beta)-hydroxysteroid dehydrogenase